MKLITSTHNIKYIRFFPGFQTYSLFNIHKFEKRKKNMSFTWLAVNIPHVALKVIKFSK